MIFHQKPCPTDAHKISKLWVENENVSENKTILVQNKFAVHP